MRDIKIENNIYIGILTNLISFLSNFNYLLILTRFNISIEFKLIDTSKPKVFYSSPIFIIEA